MANVCLTKRDIDNQATVKGVGKYEGSPTLSQNFIASVNRRLKPGPEFLPTLTILFSPSPSHTHYEALT